MIQRLKGKLYKKNNIFYWCKKYKVNREDFIVSSLSRQGEENEECDYICYPNSRFNFRNVYGEKVIHYVNVVSEFGRTQTHGPQPSCLRQVPN